MAQLAYPTAAACVSDGVMHLLVEHILAAGQYSGIRPVGGNIHVYLS